MRFFLMGLTALAVAGSAGGMTASRQGRAQISEAARCEPLPATAPVVTVVDGSRPVKIRFPDSNPVAVLTVPRGAVARPTTFTLSAPAGTERVLVEITARDGAGNAVTDFAAEPLGLEMHMRRGCTPRKPQSDRHSFYVFVLDPSDSSLVEPRGEWEDSGLLQATPRVRAQLDHLSGYIVAQGAKPPT